MRIDGFTGNVGIGTANPAALFTVNQSVGTDVGGMRLVDGAVTWSLFGDAAGDFHLKGGGSALGEMVIDSTTGNVGIGTLSPARKLDVAGDVNLGGSIFNSFVTVSGTGDTPPLAVYSSIGATGSNRALWLLSAGGTGSVWVGADGNVGVGTSTPAAKLDVAGNLNFDGQKVCHAVVPGSWHDSILAPAEWSDEACLTYAYRIGAGLFQLGCTFSDTFSLGEPTGLTAGGPPLPPAPPAPTPPGFPLLPLPPGFGPLAWPDPDCGWFVP